jgi:endonuclease/exonuclease/phosphatase family metal-dependent hydrolase
MTRRSTLFRTILGVAGLLASAAPGSSQTLEIWEIQGDGLSSPYEGDRVTTSANVVTALGPDLFFMQTPDARADGDPWTSDGIVVATGSASSVSVGDLVDVTGTVEERFGQTELSGTLEVAVTSSGHSRPFPVILTPQTPTPRQPWPETELERFEGMWIEVPSGVVSAPSDRFGEACFTAGDQRLMREPGIAYPGLAGLPVWDGNPEAIDLDPYELDGPGFELVADTVFSSRGVLTYEFGTYRLWPVDFDTVSEPELPRSVPRAHSAHLVLATQNLYRLGDPQLETDLGIRLDKLSRHLREVLGAPHVVAVQEVLDKEILQDLAERITDEDPSLTYTALLENVPGNESFDVGFLVRDPVTVRSVEQVGAEVRFTWDNTLLFDRPPLVLEATLPIGGRTLDATLVAVHLRSLSGIDDDQDGERVRRKRHEQSLWMAGWIQNRQIAAPDEPLFVLGDFNAFEFTDGYVDVLGQVTGRADPAGALLPAEEITEPALINWVDRVPAGERYSFVFSCDAQALDHILTNAAASRWVRRASFSRGNADAPRSLEGVSGTALRSSDHDGMVVSLGVRVRRVSGLRAPGS